MCRSVSKFDPTVDNPYPSSQFRHQNYQSLKTSDFDYFLPKELIAQAPADPRDSARLLVADRRLGSIEHTVFRNLRDFLMPGDLLVINETRVIPARLFGKKYPQQLQ